MFLCHYLVQLMKHVIIYDSNYGNTKQVADHMAASLGNTTSVHVDEAGGMDWKDTELLIAGSPVNAWSPTAKMKKFLNGLDPERLKGVWVAAFDTRMKTLLSGNAAKKMARSLEQSGGHLIAPPIGFYVEKTEGPLMKDQMEKVDQWIMLIKSKMVRKPAN